MLRVRDSALLFVRLEFYWRMLNGYRMILSLVRAHCLMSLMCERLLQKSTHQQCYEIEMFIIKWAVSGVLYPT